MKKVSSEVETVTNRRLHEARKPDLERRRIWGNKNEAAATTVPSKAPFSLSI